MKTLRDVFDNMHEYEVFGEAYANLVKELEHYFMHVKRNEEGLRTENGYKVDIFESNLYSHCIVVKALEILREKTLEEDARSKYIDFELFNTTKEGDIFKTFKIVAVFNL